MELRHADKEENVNANMPPSKCHVSITVDMANLLMH